jgi:hypothetical protein
LNADMALSLKDCFQRLPIAASVPTRGPRRLHSTTNCF